MSVRVPITMSRLSEGRVLVKELEPRRGWAGGLTNRAGATSILFVKVPRQAPTAAHFERFPQGLGQRMSYIHTKNVIAAAAQNSASVLIA